MNLIQEVKHDALSLPRSKANKDVFLSEIRYLLGALAEATQRLVDHKADELSPPLQLVVGSWLSWFVMTMQVGWTKFARGPTTECLDES
jgi:hypothetical protein